MSAARQIGIKMVVDARSVTTELDKAARSLQGLGSGAEQGGVRATRSLAQVSMSVRDIVQGALGLQLVGKGLESIHRAITALPRQAFDFSAGLEVSRVGMAGILGSMTAINGQQLDYNRALQISGQYINKLNDDALRTAATAATIQAVFQALLAPGLGAKMTMEEIRQLTVVGTNAVKSIGLDGRQVVQELRDLVAGGIQPASSTLATALGLKDSDIARAKASSEGLFKFLMARLQGFEAASNAFGDTFKGKLEQLREGATRVAASGLEPLVTASKAALDGVAGLFVTIDKNQNVTLNQGLVDSLKTFSNAAVTSTGTLRDLGAGLYEHRTAVLTLAAAYASMRFGVFVSDMARATTVKLEAVQASRLAAVQAAAEAAGNMEVAATSRQKLAAYLAELTAKVADAQAEGAAQAARRATLATTQEAIVAARAETLAKLDAVRATMAQAEAQMAAARAAGAQSVALALLREGTDALSAAQARQAALVTELALLGKQQAGVQAAMAAATAAHTAATDAAAAASARLGAAQGAASLAGRALSGAVGFLGGPIGIVTTALTLGASAWALWGSAGSEAERKLQTSVARSTPQILADLDAQIARLKTRNAMAASGAGDIARAQGAAAEQAQHLLTQIQNLGAGKGADGGAAPPEATRALVMAALSEQYNKLTGRMREAQAQQQKLDSGTGQITLTVQGAEQAWRKSIDGVKTASQIQQEYTNKLQASREAFKGYAAQLEGGAGANPQKLRQAQAEQAQVEKQLAAERDKDIKQLGAAAAGAREHALDAQVAATKQGYKLLAAQTADGLAEVQAQHKLGLIGDMDALQRRTALQLADIDAQRLAVAAELALAQQRREGAKDQANLQGELAELAQKRANIEAAAAREQRELDAQSAQALQARIDGYEQAARAAAHSQRAAQLDGQEIGKTGTALGALRQARVEATAKALEHQATLMAGIDLSGRASAALREQAQSVRELAKTSGYNESARMVSEYAKAIEEASEATQFELGLSGLSQRDRAVALAQYRVAIALKHQIAAIDAANPADAAAAAKLRAQAEAAAAQAQKNAADQALLADWQRTVDQVDDIFRQGFADMLNKGQDGWKAFTQSLATTFKTTVANEIYKAFAQPLVIRLVGSMAGLLGGPSAALAGQASGALGGVGTLSNLANLPSAISGLMSPITSLGGSIASLGSTLGSTSMTGFGMGMQGMVIDNALMGTYGASASAGAGAGSALASALPWVGAGLLAANALGLFRGTEQRGSGLTGTLGTAGGIKDTALMRKDGTLFQGPDYWAEAGATSKLDRAIQQQFAASNAALVGFARSMGLATDAADGFTTAFGADKFHADNALKGIQTEGKSDQEVQALIAAAIKSGSNDLAQQLIGTFDAVTTEVTRQVRDTVGGWDGDSGSLYRDVKESVTTSTYKPSEFARDGEQAIDTLTRLGQSLAVFNGAFKALHFEQFASTLAGGDMASQLADELGGLDAAQQRMQAFYSTFIPAQQQYQFQLEGVRGVFDQLNLSLPASRAQFAQIVQGLDLTTARGQETFAALMGVSEQFAHLIPDLSGVAGDMSGILTQSLLGTFEGDNVGAAMADAVSDGIYSAIAGGFAAQISDILLQGVVEPMVTAALTGASVSSAVSSAAIDDMIARAQAVADVAEQVLGNEDFKAAMARVHASVASIQVPVVRARVAVQQYTAAVDRSADAARAASDAWDAAFNALSRSVGADKTALQKTLSDAQRLEAEYNGLFGYLRDQVRDLRGQGEAGLEQQAAQGRAAMAAALSAYTTSGVLPAQQALSEAVQSVRAGIDAGWGDSTYERMVLANQLAQLKNGSEAALSEQERIVSATEAQVGALDALLENAREQLDIAKGTWQATLALPQALAAFNAALAGSAGAPVAPVSIAAAQPSMAHAGWFDMAAMAATVLAPAPVQAAPLPSLPALPSTPPPAPLYYASAPGASSSTDPALAALLQKVLDALNALKGDTSDGAYHQRRVSELLEDVANGSALLHVREEAAP